jgi:hypothetical protein
MSRGIECDCCCRVVSAKVVVEPRDHDDIKFLSAL